MGEFNKGVYPVMLTPFKNNEVDYASLEKLVDWYLKNDVAGLFAVCQSSEMFFLSLEERVKISESIVKQVAGKVPVLTSGHISADLEDQIIELTALSKTGVDALILISNRLAKEDESDDTWIENLKYLLGSIPKDIPLGFYECPYPYKRILSPKMLTYLVGTDRFYFLKDTSCDITNIAEKLEIIKGSKLKLYNANSATLIDSLKIGASGYSGVMANFHPNLYSKLCKEIENPSINGQLLADFLTSQSFIERQNYPLNAKLFQKQIGNFTSEESRVKRNESMKELEISELSAFENVWKSFEKNIELLVRK